MYKFVKNQGAVHLKSVDFIVCKSYVNKSDFKKFRSPGIRIPSLPLTYQMTLGRIVYVWMILSSYGTDETHSPSFITRSMKF